ncbi:MAG TPA: hypothetical protein VFW78_13320 [Bacteroidia bacterium]|nr:hypothetical protein [Bacteroidia bacterium]
MRSLLKRTSLFVFLVLVSISATYSQSFLDKDSVLKNPKVYVCVGMFSPVISTSLRIDSDNGLGSDLSLEDDFKLPSSIAVFKSDIYYRVKNRSQFVFSYTAMKRSKEFTINKDINFADTSFYVNSDVKIYFKTFYYGLTWKYSVWNKPGWNAGFSVGLRALQLKTGIEANLNANSYKADESVIAPALLYGIHGSGYLTPRFLARYSMEYFQLSVSGIKMIILENKFTLEYYLHKNVGIGGGYQTSLYNVKEIPFNDNFNGRVRFVFSGFQLFANARF